MRLREYSVKNENKYCRENNVLLTNRQEISAYFTVFRSFFFSCGPRTSIVQWLFAEMEVRKDRCPREFRPP